MIRARDVRSIEELYTLPDETLLQLARSVRFYHTIDIRDGITLRGSYDHRPFVGSYHFPDLTGKKVLDVGRASGFFSFLFERMGAREVVALDLPPNTQKNIPGLDRAADGQTVGRLDFFVAHALLRSRVKPIWLDVADISPDAVGSGYDVAFVGSVLCHLADPMGTLSRIRRVLSPDGICIIANPISPKEHLLSFIIRKPIAVLSGTDSPTSWWTPNIACLKLMCVRAGFKRVELKTRNLPLRRKKKHSLVRHAVVHARPVA